MTTGVNLLCALGVLLAGEVACGDGARLGATPAPGSTARTNVVAEVVAELFTSEGCSSCPPADDVLSQLVRRQPIPGVEVLALGEHVDYWDRLGWRDPFSSSAFTTRQAEYDGQIFRSSVYTPQLVVDGALERIGSDRDAVEWAIRQVARAPKAAVDIAIVQRTDATLRLHVHVNMPADVVIRDRADLLVAVTEDNLMTNVRHGENGGRTLRHSAVMRSLTTVGALRVGERTMSTTPTIPWDPDWKSADVRVIGFLQERTNRRIVGAGAVTMGPAAVN